MTDVDVRTSAPAPAQRAGVCQKCGKEPGRLYVYVVGTETQSSKWVGPKTLQKTTTWTPQGELVCYVCDACAERRRHAWRKTYLAGLGLFGLVALVGLVWWVAAQDAGGFGMALMAGVYGLVLYAVFRWNQGRSTARIAERLGLSVMRRQEARGERRVWTPERFRKGPRGW